MDFGVHSAAAMTLLESFQLYAGLRLFALGEAATATVSAHGWKA